MTTGRRPSALDISTSTKLHSVPLEVNGAQWLINSVDAIMNLVQSPSLTPSYRGCRVALRTRKWAINRARRVDSPLASETELAVVMKARETSVLFRLAGSRYQRSYGASPLQGI